MVIFTLANWIAPFSKDLCKFILALVLSVHADIITVTNSLYYVYGHRNTVLIFLCPCSTYRNVEIYFGIINIRMSLYKNNNTPIFHTCLTSCWSCLCSTTGHLVVHILGGVVEVKNRKKNIVSSWFHRKLNFLEKSIFGHFYDSIGYI
jgi:hypothetical protein